MHEASLVRGLVAQVERIAQENAATTVVSIDIWLGALAQISPDHLRDHFVEAARGSITDGANLMIEQSEEIHHAQAQEIILKGVEVLDRESA